MQPTQPWLFQKHRRREDESCPEANATKCKTLSAEGQSGKPDLAEFGWPETGLVSIESNVV
jgi:hypothetical protein